MLKAKSKSFIKLKLPATAKLKVLDLSSNNIRDIPNGVLQKMYKLETLNLENNPITFQQNQEYFKGLTNLKVRKPGEQPRSPYSRTRSISRASPTSR